jgi:3',5'-cyclic AMP phosphodiesterase CpdA
MSDLHFSPKSPRKRWEAFGQALIDAAAQGTDHLVLSGDLVESRWTEGITKVMKHCGQAGFKGPNCLSVVPGNHDIHGDHRDPLNLITDNPQSAEKRWNKSVQPYAIGPLSTGASLFGNQPLPWGKHLRRSIGMVGIDTLSLSGLWKSAQGRIDPEDLAAANQFFATHKHTIRILVMHHWPWDMEFVSGGLIDQNFTDPPPSKVRDMLRGLKLDVVLCGHAHDALESRIGPGRVFCSASEDRLIRCRFISIGASVHSASKVVEYDAI